MFYQFFVGEFDFFLSLFILLLSKSYELLLKIDTFKNGMTVRDKKIVFYEDNTEVGPNMQLF